MDGSALGQRGRERNPMAFKGWFKRFKEQWKWRKRHLDFVRRMASQVEELFTTNGDEHTGGLMWLHEQLEREAEACGFSLGTPDAFKSLVTEYNYMKTGKTVCDTNRDAYIKSVLESLHGEALSKENGDESALRLKHEDECQKEDGKYCTYDCMGRHDCHGHRFCERCGEAKCGCDVTYVGEFAICKPCLEELKGVSKNGK